MPESPFRFCVATPLSVFFAAPFHSAAKSGKKVSLRAGSASSPPAHCSSNKYLFKKSRLQLQWQSLLSQGCHATCSSPALRSGSYCVLSASFIQSLTHSFHFTSFDPGNLLQVLASRHLSLSS